ncbi:MAG: peptidoglycan-associated lipoprotein Pal [Desulfobacterales bacterium]|nr:peptidoglycan-associated lipoprotein Pal [Desulfobacterales bacterium]MDJ0991312.1 peptidoglycan-associated lipoprotein Pal [Desulfobacterales bacterium]
MLRKLWIILALMLVVPGLLTMVSCATQSGGQQTETTTPPEAPAKPAAPAADTSGDDRADAMARNQFLSEHVPYAFDSAALSPMAQSILKRKAAWLNDNRGEAVVIQGHCDERGTAEYNLALGERRAESARAYLIDLGIASSRLSTISYGEERPLDPRSNEEAWAKNRRSQFVIK